MKAVRIRKLMIQANDPAATPAETEAYLEMAAKLRRRYRHGDSMTV
jgi:Protein of unknown function (DUF2786)